MNSRTINSSQGLPSSTVIRQCFLLLRVSLSHYLRKPLYLAAIILTFVVVAGVSVLTFAVRGGLQNVIDANQQPGLYFLMNGKGNTELTSLLNSGQQRYPSNMSGVAQQQGRAQFSPELVLLSRQTFDKTQSDFIVRGVTPSAFSMKDPRSGLPYAVIRQGKDFSPGKRELLIGAELIHRYPQLRPGYSLKIHGTQWQIIGTFTSGGSVRESEIWADREMLRTEFGVGSTVNVVAFFSVPGITLNQLNDELGQIEKGPLSISDSQTHYASHGQDLASLLAIFGSTFAIIGGVIVLSGVAVLVESLLVNVTAELRALRLIGYGQVLFFAFTAPILLCSLIGGLAGTGLYGLVAMRLTFSTMAGPSEMVFHASLNLSIILFALAYCMFIALFACLINYRRVMKIIASKH